MSTFDEAVQDIKKAKSVLTEDLEKNEVEFQHPDPVKHKYISFAKSAVRIAAGVALCYSMFWYAGSLLILAEVLGVVEEMV
jgi:hypothetical protein